uniref:Uncharacterized protein n=1 Tax=Gorilla gorilla gorilla TaxID=9595 RepID=G3RP43_GORGO
MQERAVSQEARSRLPLLPTHAMPSEGLSFPSRTVQDLDILNVKSTFQFGILAPTPSPHSGSGPPIMILPQNPDLAIPDEEGAQEEDDEAHNARGIPPLGLIALGACHDCLVAQLGWQMGVAFLFWRWEHNHPQPMQARPR